MATFVEYRVSEGVAEIVMNRAPVNAINHALAREMFDAFMRANDLDYRRAMEGVVEMMCSLKDTADSKEALRAFAEKRAARYS